MKTRKLILAATLGMTFGAVALAADSGMQTNPQAGKQQLPSTGVAPARQDSQPAQIGGGAGPVTGADFDREAKAVGRALQRGEISIATSSEAPAQKQGAAGSGGQLMRRSGEATDTGSAGFDTYVDQVNRQLKQREPASE